MFCCCPAEEGGGVGVLPREPCATQHASHLQVRPQCHSDLRWKPEAKECLWFGQRGA